MSAPVRTSAITDGSFEEEDEAPPFLRTWPRVYGAVLLYLVLLLTVLSIVSHAAGQ